MNGNDPQAGHDGGFGGVFRRHEHAQLAVGPGLKGDGQNAFARTHRAGERQFADHDEMLELVGFNLLAGGEDADGDGQVETRAFLFHIGGREVDGSAAHGKFETGVDQRGGDAVARFFHRGVRQTDDDDEGVALTGIDLDFDGVGFDAVARQPNRPWPTWGKTLRHAVDYHRPHWFTTRAGAENCANDWRHTSPPPHIRPPVHTARELEIRLVSTIMRP